MACLGIFASVDSVSSTMFRIANTCFRTKLILNWTEKNLVPRISETVPTSLTECKYCFTQGLWQIPNQHLIISLPFMAWTRDLPNAFPPLSKHCRTGWLGPCNLSAWWQPFSWVLGLKCCGNGKHWLAELWSWSDASCVQSPHFDFILFLLSYGFGFHSQDKFNIFI